MKKSKIIEELIVAIGYALDAGNDHRTSEDRKECREIAEKILNDIVQSNELKDCRQEPD